jgi:alanyl-tRNA synthetase
MNYREIRKSFLEYFSLKNHRLVPSSGLVLYDDPTLLFANAGMNQFKDVFLGKGKRDYCRAVNAQKCIRVSGKHNDLDEVGRDTYHHTFFEMLGNWSFGDYYKKEAIEWAWILLTDIWGLPKNKLWATVYKTDDESFQLWSTVTDIDKNHILRFGEKENFWEMGETGPCGPCSEIHFDLTDFGCKPEDVNASPSVIEIWNLVFIQNNRKLDGILENLPAKHVDTGMGFERICSILQKKKSNYDTDIFSPLFNKISEIVKCDYEEEKNQLPMRVLADHVRSLTFALTDGVVPSNDGRGYVMKRILRRASRFARNLEVYEPILYKLVPTVVEGFSDFYPELKDKQDLVKKIVLAEEESFNFTLDKGLEIFEDIAKKNHNKGIKVIEGHDVFKLYDTYGFPIDLTNIIAEEKGFSIDIDGFNKLMKNQIERSKTNTKVQNIDFKTDLVAILGLDAKDDNSQIFGEDKKQNINNISPTIFIGYNENESNSKILFKKYVDDKSYVIFDKTPCYAESGGQISDIGEIMINGISSAIIGVVKLGSYFIHIIENEIPDLTECTLKIDAQRRRRIMQNHSATHLLHAALRNILGSHVQQAGSLVDEERLRFDFTHFQKVKLEELKLIEKFINQKILEAVELQRFADINQEEAKNMGALAFFGDKYGDKVNVIKFGDFSIEFCGGTHVHNTSDIGLFKIISESSISSGVRRIEGVTSIGIERYINSLEEKIIEKQKDNDTLIEKIKFIEKGMKKFRSLAMKDEVSLSINRSIIIGDVKVVSMRVEVEGADEIKQVLDIAKEKLSSGVVVIGSVIYDKAQIAALVTEDIIKTKKLAAGKIVSEVAKIIGGAGGGKPNFATAGGKDIEKLDLAIKSVNNIVKKMLEN